MSDMSSTIIAKSDQLNADDLISGAITIRIRDTKVASTGEQPVSIFYDGDNNKPWKPCKSMARVLVAAWGASSKAYIGKSLTLFRDPSVKWAGMEVGGIRISHMSDIGGTQTIPITVTRGNKKPYLVKPLTPVPSQQTAPEEPTDDELNKAGNAAADKGSDALKAWWTSIGAKTQKRLGVDFLNTLKGYAKKADDAQNAEIPLPD
jgi:hypothetical protein